MMTPDRSKAVIYGLACGDALGAPTEFMGMEGIRRRFGQAGIRNLVQTNGRFTDDTCMTIAIAEGLLDAAASIKHERAAAELLGHPVCTADMADPHFVMPVVVKHLIRWLRSDQSGRAPGNTCMGGCRNLENGAHWLESGIKHSKGCGGVMRTAPVGLVYDEPETIMEIAKAQAICTHGHPSAWQAAQLGALAVHMLARGKVTGGDITAEFLLPDLMETCGWELGEYDPKLLSLLDRVPRALKATLAGEITPERVMVNYGAHDLALGESWHGDEALASSLYCFLLAHARGEGYVETVRYGANTVGDSDSIGCISGAFAGAYWGLGGQKGVPADWIERIEDSSYLANLAERLVEAA